MKKSDNGEITLWDWTRPNLKDLGYRVPKTWSINHPEYVKTQVIKNYPLGGGKRTQGKLYKLSACRFQNISKLLLNRIYDISIKSIIYLGTIP